MNIDDSVAWRRIVIYLIGLVVVPTVLLALYGVGAIRAVRLRLEDELDRRVQTEARSLEQDLVGDVASTEEALRKGLDLVAGDDLVITAAALKARLPLVAAIWVIEPPNDAVPDWVIDAVEAADMDHRTIVPVERGERDLVVGVLHLQAHTTIAWQLDSKELDGRIAGHLAAMEPEAVGHFRLRTERDAETRSLQDALAHMADPPAGEGLFTKAMAPPLDRWRLEASAPDGDPLAHEVRRTVILYIAGMVLLLAAVVTGVVLMGRAMVREMRLSQLLTDFVSNVSHELRTPLTSIRMFIETLQSGRVQDPVRVQECLDVVSTESERLSRMIDRILGWARMEAGRRIYAFERISVEKLVARAVDAFRTQLIQDTGTQLEVHLQPDLPEVLADAEAMTEALLNLLNNAWKYTGTEKKIRIETRIDRDMVGICVIDNGPGIPAGERARIFEKFYRSDHLLTRKTQGSGLGLAIVRAIAQAHQGKVDLDTEEGRGSRFTLWLRAPH